MKTNKQVTALAKPEPTKLKVMEAAAEAAQLVNQGFEKIGDALSKNLKPGPLAYLYVLLDKNWKKVIEHSRNEANARLKALIEEKGQASKENPNAKYLTVEYGTDKFNLRKIQQMSFDEVEFKALLERKKIKMSEACDQVVSQVVNNDKVHKLIEDGRITKEEYEACKRPRGEGSLSVEKM